MNKIKLEDVLKLNKKEFNKWTLEMYLKIFSTNINSDKNKWVKEIGGLKVRVYELDDKDIYYKGLLIRLSNGINFVVYQPLHKDCKEEVYTFIDGEFYKYFKIPIMPYGNSKQDFMTEVSHDI